MFLNCNYPHEYKIPKGKPKEITSKTTKLTLIKDSTKLIVLNNGDVYFTSVRSGYYWGIEIPKFLSTNIFHGVTVSETISKINIALLEWGDGRGLMCEQLSNTEQDLLETYLLTLRW